MSVPANLIARPVLMINLDEPHVALRQSAGHQALPTEIVRLGLVETIQLARGIGFLGNVECLGSFRLHAERELECLYARLQLRVILPAGGTGLVHLLNHVQLIALLLGSEARVFKVLNRLYQVLRFDAAVAHCGALVRGWQEPGAPVLRAAVRKPRLERNERRQILILRAQPVHYPGACAGAREGVRARVQLQHSTAMRHAVSYHRAENAELVRKLRNVRKQLADFDTALAVLPELPWRLEQVA